MTNEKTHLTVTEIAELIGTRRDRVQRAIERLGIAPTIRASGWTRLYEAGVVGRVRVELHRVSLCGGAKL